ARHVRRHAGGVEVAGQAPLGADAEHGLTRLDAARRSAPRSSARKAHALRKRATDDVVRRGRQGRRRARLPVAALLAALGRLVTRRLAGATLAAATRLRRQRRFAAVRGCAIAISEAVFAIFGDAAAVAALRRKRARHVAQGGVAAAAA